jgi:hypothetical protein
MIELQAGPYPGYTQHLSSVVAFQSLLRRLLAARATMGQTKPRFLQGFTWMLSGAEPPYLIQINAIDVAALQPAG